MGLNWKGGFYQMGKAGVEQSKIELVEKLRTQRETTLENLRNKNQTARIDQEGGIRAEAATVANTRGMTAEALRVENAQKAQLTGFGLDEVRAQNKDARAVTAADTLEERRIAAAELVAEAQASRDYTALLQASATDKTKQGSLILKQITQAEDKIKSLKGDAADESDPEVVALRETQARLSNSYLTLNESADYLALAREGHPGAPKAKESSSEDSATGQAGGTMTGGGADPNPIIAQQSKKKSVSNPASQEEVRALIEQDKVKGADEATRVRVKKQVTKALNDVEKMFEQQDNPGMTEGDYPGRKEALAVSDREEIIQKERGLKKISLLFDLFAESPSSFTRPQLKVANRFIEEFNALHSLRSPFPLLELPMP